MRVDVALDGEPVVGSFTVDGMTFAVAGDGPVELVGVSSDRQQATSPQEGDGSPVAPMLASGPDGTVLALPESVAYEGIDYTVSSIGAYAFYLSGVTSVELPVSIIDVDERAFRSSDVASVEVDPDNLSYASYDGILYDADLTRLLLIPGGRMGAARISDKAEEVGAQAFSHCAGVTSISVDAGSDSYSSWDGLLYDAPGATLLRVPAGATDITIRDGCTTIAAGALEGCAQLCTITAPASVTSISPDLFTSVPTVSLPAALAILDENTKKSGKIEVGTYVQLTALVALSSAVDEVPQTSSEAIEVMLGDDSDELVWQCLGFKVIHKQADEVIDQKDSYSSTLSEATAYEADYPICTVQIYAGIPAEGALTTRLQSSGTLVHASTVSSDSGGWYVLASLTGSRIEFYGSPGGQNATVWDFPNDLVSGFSTVKSRVVGAYIDNTYYTDATYSTPLDFRYETNLNAFLKWGWTQYSINYRANGGDGAQASVGNMLSYSSITLPNAEGCNITRLGYTLSGWAVGTTTFSPGATISVEALAQAAGCQANKVSDSVTLDAKWSLNSYDISYDFDGGSASGNPTAYNVETASFTLQNPTKVGYVFAGWSGTGLTGNANTDVTVAQGSTGDRAYTAHWTPAISADVPLEVTARVDLLGIEEQEEAQGYIESRCGEPLTVADVAFEPLSGAAELFGAASVADVALEVLAADSASPDARFALDASASQAPASSATFRMASYGTRVPISYRFAIPDELLPSLVETEKPVCSVAYTVALA